MQKNQRNVFFSSENRYNSNTKNYFNEKDELSLWNIERGTAQNFGQT